MTQQVLHAKIQFTTSDSLMDASSMSFTFEATGSNTTIDPTECTDTCIGFVNNLKGTQSVPMSSYLSTDLSRVTNASTVSLTDVTGHLDGTPAGTPIVITPFTLGPTGPGSVLPGQLAVVCGYRAAYGLDLEHGPTIELPSDESAQDQGAPATHMGATRPRARDRGRIYFGPLGSNVLLTNTGSGPDYAGKLDPAFVAQISDALNGILETQFPAAETQFNAVVWSRRNQAVKTVAFFYIDEGVGTVRKRQDTAVAREHTWVAVT